MKRSIKQIWHPYWKWEEVRYNMWGSVADPDKFLKRAVKFTGDHKLYGKWMVKVVEDWHYSCEHNLTAVQNRQAWIGHAAVAYAFQCPEDIVRTAWWELTDKQRELANKEADKAIKYWENNHAEKNKKTKRLGSFKRQTQLDF